MSTVGIELGLPSPSMAFSPWHAILLAHALACGGMFGLIWFVQIVHYPLFTRVGAEDFARYEAEHQTRTTFVVGPLMLIQAATAGLILSGGLAGVMPLWWGTVAVGLVALQWGLTFFISVPLHARLQEGFDEHAAKMLVRTNWPRTIAWTAHAMLALWMLVSFVGMRTESTPARAAQPAAAGADTDR